MSMACPLILKQSMDTITRWRSLTDRIDRKKFFGPSHVKGGDRSIGTNERVWVASSLIASLHITIIISSHLF